jgi:cell surface protein SprA
VENSKGSLISALKRLGGVTAGALILIALGALLSVHVAGKTASRSVLLATVTSPYISIPDTIEIIYEDIDRRPSRFQGRRAPDRISRPGIDGPGETDAELTRDELQRRMAIRVDSTARIEHFRYRRTDRPYVTTSKPRSHPFYLANNNRTYSRSVELDSLGQTVIVRETVDGKDVKIPMHIPLDEYIEIRAREIERQGWEQRAYAYDIEGAATEQRDLGDFLSSITTIDIPVPPNPLLNIFGKPGIRLNISGAVDIRAGFRRQKTDQATTSLLGNVRNEPDFKQDVQINVSGIVGDKLNINADWNTQRTFEFENQLKIVYTGYEDEIIKSVEAGNVTLQTPSQFIGSSQALFGIKSLFQFGPFRLTTVASQQKGRSQELSVSGGSQEQSFEIKPYDYVRNHFFISEEYIELYEPAFDIEPVWNPMLEVVEIEVWRTRTGIRPDLTERPATTHIDLPPLPPGGYDASYRDTDIGEGVTGSGEIEFGQFELLTEGTDYSLDPRVGRLTLRTSIPNEQVIAVAYRRVDGTVFGELLGETPEDSSRLVLKLVKPRNLSPLQTKAWQLQLRNIYQIGGRGLQQEGFDLRVEYETPGQEPTDQLEGQPLLQVLGLDRVNESGALLPDNKFDWRPGVTIDISRGELIFPSLRPFDDNLVEAELGAYSYPEVYDTTATAARAQTAKDRFRIRGKYSSSVTSSYSLGFNVVEGSVRVTLNGAPLQIGTDYTVDYVLGQVVIRNEAALQPGANLRISYEQNELFQIASKTLLGARGEMPLGRNTDINFTLMSLSEETLSDKVRVGEEPISNTIFGIDGRTTLPVNFVTRAMNWLPFYNSNAESNLSLSGEAAYISPDRNTKKSTITLDENKGVAFIDDFEGARRSIPLGVSYVVWKYASPPARSPMFAQPIPADSMVQHKARTAWFTPTPSDVLIDEIWPERQAARGEDRVPVIEIRYNPRERGEYNYSMDLENTVFNSPQNSWGGLMRGLTGTVNNLIDENINFIEFWMQVRGGDVRDGKMFINLGQINERIIYDPRVRNRQVNGVHTEDGVQGAQPTGFTRPEEDVGLDGLTSDEERGVFADFIASYPQFASDPSGDNYRRPSGGTFVGVNGVEGNLDTDHGNVPDTEDLNRNGITDIVNHYFQYTINLDTTNALTENPYVVGGGNNGWYQFRIPIADVERENIGQPSLDNVEHIRVWFTGFDDSIQVRLAEFSFTGNQWEEEIRNDPVFFVSVVSVEETPSYESPPGVRRARDRTRPDLELYANEQSLAMVLTDLPPGETRRAFRNFPARAIDIFNYRAMRMFVHGDRAWYTSDDATERAAEIILRFGADTLNYYEYRQPVWPGWDERNNIDIDFGQLTAAKAQRDTSSNMSPYIPVPNGPPGSTYRVVRNPSLTTIRHMSIGVQNPGNENGGGRPLTGEMWVNELRLIDVDNTPGWAYRVASSFNLSDFGTVRFNMSETDPNFHRLDRRFGNRQTLRSWDAGVNLSLQRFLPESWRGTELPFNYSRSESIISPRYIPGTDILISGVIEQEAARLEAEGFEPEEARKIADQLRVESQTVRVSDSYSAPNIRVSLPSPKWYVKETINNIRMGFNYNKTFDRSPTVERRENWAWQARMNYQLNFSQNNFWQPFKNLFDDVPLLSHYKDVKFFYSPANFNSGLNLARTRTDERLRIQAQERPTSRNFTATRNFGFNWRFTENALINPGLDYRLNISSSLVHLELDEFGNQRPFTHIMTDVFSGGAALMHFGIDNNYNQEIRLESRPRLPSLWDINRYFEITTGYGANYRWTRNLSQEVLGRSAGVNSRYDFTLGMNLRELGNKLFGEQQQPPQGQQAPQRGRARGEDQPAQQDSVKKVEEEEKEKTSGFAAIKNILRLAIKVPFLDYDRITISFNQNKNAQNSGLMGGTGFNNLWGKIPFYDDDTILDGPSRKYQFGLTSQPAALRAPNGNLVDNFSETNRISMRTQRQLWQGARIDLNWNYSWSYNRNQSLQTNDIGQYSIANTTKTGDVDRSFMTLPPVLFFKILGGNIEEVAKLYAEKLDSESDPERQRKLSDAFEEGMEAASILGKFFGGTMPRVNWNFRWEGLEKISIFQSWARRVSLDHAYTSNYTRRWRGRVDGTGQQTEMQRIAMSFNPLLGVNIMFNELGKGNLSANMRYNTSTTYDLNYSRGLIIQNLTNEISFTASYGRRGFAIPLFGISMSNDIDISLTFSRASNERLTYDNLLVSTEAKTDDGSTRTSFEPRIRYVLSSRVTASLFYRHAKISPNRAGSLTPGTTTNEAGLDINISIR